MVASSSSIRLFAYRDMMLLGSGLALLGVVLPGLAFAARETVSEAAYHARDLVSHRSDGIGTFMTTFPSNYSDEGLQNLPIGGLEYFAPATNGDLYILAMPISKQIHNAIAAPHHNATMSVKDEDAERRLGRWGATDRNRAIFFGSLQTIEEDEEIKKAEKVFAKTHKDAKAYFPGTGPHYAYWAVLKVSRVYWIGGFGDTHYIGWIPLELYNSATRHQKERSRLLIQAA